MSKYPNPKEPCYDCGSKIPGHHTTLCDPFMSQDGIRDLPTEEPNVQYWSGDLSVIDDVLGRVTGAVTGYSHEGYPMVSFNGNPAVVVFPEMIVP